MSDARSLVAVFDSPVAGHLLAFAATLGYRTALADPRLDGVDIDAGTDSSCATTTAPSWARSCAPRSPRRPAGSA
ncbi:hypothetical protein [Dactylosporangium matsuzakiense]|uniref:Uncharacterized protein n=1 Tax=Dactylosporangium matsuzakiense TaxID=53360 RepID=A0A9W6KR93_9ACTN|nr:hypothetical protein [Dactylosporangium matsuzakiense]GLL05808.1 hypothetical protein GCM10017581_075550 [Dactylosporangium matsuzakiense]